MAKYKEIRERLTKRRDAKVNITALVSEAWRKLEPLERQKFEAMSRQDKVRYDIEKQNYVPPPGLSVGPKRRRKPGAPKRPMSAYLSYANKLRGKVKAENPNCSNGEISKILSNMWKAMSDKKRKEYKDNEKIQWGVYREKMIEWEKNTESQEKETGATSELFSIKKIDKKAESHNLGPIEFSSHTVVDNDVGVDEQLLSLGSVPGIDTNPNMTDEMMAASALRGVRGGPQQHLGVESGDSPHSNAYGCFLVGSETNGGQHMSSDTTTTGYAGFGQVETQYQYVHHLGENNRKYKRLFLLNMLQSTITLDHAQQLSKPFVSSAMDQQVSLSQLASLAGVQHDVLH